MIFHKIQLFFLESKILKFKTIYEITSKVIKNVSDA